MLGKLRVFFLLALPVLCTLLYLPAKLAAQETELADAEVEYEDVYEDDENWEEYDDEEAVSGEAQETGTPAESAPPPATAPESQAATAEEPVLQDEEELEFEQEPKEAAPAEEPTAAGEDLEATMEEEYFPEPEFEAEESPAAPATAGEEDMLPDAVEEEEEFEITEEDVGELQEEEGEPGVEAGGFKEEEYEDEYWETEATAQETEEMAAIDTALEESKRIPTVLTSLEDCKRVALINSPRVQVALREVKYERYKVMEAERDFLPQVKGSWERQEGKSDQSGGGGGGGGNFSGLKYGVETTQKLFTSGKNLHTLKQAKTKLVVAKKKYEQAKQEAIYNVEKAYYELVKTQMVFEIQADLSKAAESALSFSREAYRQGLNTYQEFLNVQSQTDQTYYHLLSSQQDIALAELKLRQACNVDASIGVQINAVLTFTDFDFNYSLDECLSLSFKNRPDLAVNEFTTLADLYGIKVQMAEDMPQIEFVGQVGKNGQSQKGEGLELSDEWSMKLQATWIIGANSAQYSWENKKSVPTKFGQQDNTKDSQTQNMTMSLFDKLENFSNLAKAKVDKATSEADLVELRGNVANEVEENYFNYQKAMTMVTASLSKIKFREKDLEINRAKQMMNEIPLSQVLTSELQLGEERVNYVQALADYYTSISGLFKAMGLSK
ncbi:TolC family protein [candidate division FCPU426 bacterium]|nr:TolC family protein [candidate division FCPU426 bacterium]